MSSESGCLGMQPKAGGKLHLRLNTDTSPIADKYREGKSKRIHNISFPQFRAMVNTCSADGDRVCCDEALVMRHWEHRVGRPLSASRILVNPVLV